jgi:hypothetical protein
MSVQANDTILDEMRQDSHGLEPIHAGDNQNILKRRGPIDL